MWMWVWIATTPTTTTTTTTTTTVAGACLCPMTTDSVTTLGRWMAIHLVTRPSPLRHCPHPPSLQPLRRHHTHTHTPTPTHTHTHTHTLTHTHTHTHTRRRCPPRHRRHSQMIHIQTAPAPTVTCRCPTTASQTLRSKPTAITPTVAISPCACLGQDTNMYMSRVGTVGLRSVP